ncbi:MAG: patatin-like phospholipase family protein [Vicinamibacterales bacterium]
MPRGPRAAHDLYSPERPTAVILSGVGADGAYHAGVLKALHEAGVKVDLVAGRGVGALGALLFAVDGAAALWEPLGFWRRPGLAAAYRLTWRYRAIGGALAAAAALVVSPLLLLAGALVVWPVALALGLLGLDAGAALAGRYAELVAWAFAPGQLPTWIPRLVLLLTGGVAAMLGAAAFRAARRSPRRQIGAPWWRLLGGPIDSRAFARLATGALWDLLRGGAALARPSAPDLSQRYTELLAASAGQPGQRDLLLAVHDLDARRDLVFGQVAGEPGARLFPGPAGPSARRAEAFALTGEARSQLADIVAAAATLPAVSEPHPIRFAADGYWRGEVHRASDRAGLLTRLLEETAAAGVEQVLVVTATPEPAAPHALTPARLDARGRLGAWLAADETAAVRDAVRFAHAHFHAVFVIRPAHNALGPLDLDGADDAAADRRLTPADLVARGADDAHRLFIEPALGAAGDKVAEAGWTR